MFFKADQLEFIELADKNSARIYNTMPTVLYL